MSLFRTVLKALGSLALFVLWLSVFADHNANGESVNRDPSTQVGPRDFCMFSALYNGLEGDVYEEDRDEPVTGCTLYMCAIVLDSDGQTYEYEVIDCGEGLTLRQAIYGN